MENNCIGIINIPDNLKRFVTIMRITLFLIFFGILYTHAAEGFSQKTPFILDVKSTSIKDICEELEKNSNYRFIFAGNVKNTVNKKVSLTVNTQNINEILDNILTDSNLTYRILDDQIVIFENETKITNNEVTEIILQQANTITVRGNVTDMNSEPLIGATITVQGDSTYGVVTDVDGNYTINVDSRAVLQFSYIGFITQHQEVENRQVINVILQEDVGQLDEVVVVGYGNQRRESVIGAITTVSPSTLQVNQTRSLSNSLAGQVTGIIAVQRSGEPGYDDSDFWIRGINTFGANANPLVLIDGIERSMSNISPEEIESFSVLKDATATAVYGVRGANGVILIQTKKGKVGKARITLKADYGISNPTQLPKFLDAVKYMQISNEAMKLSGFAPIYSEEAIEKTRIGYDSDLYPNVNWLEAITKENTPTGRLSFDINGGSERLRYSLVGSFFSEKGMLVRDEKQNYNSDIKLNKYTIRSNVDLDLTASTNIAVSIGGYATDRTSPGWDIGEIFWTAMDTPPNAHPMIYSDGTLPKNAARRNPWVTTTQTGYRRGVQSNIESSVNLTQDFGKLWQPLKGLTGNVLASFDAYNWHNQDRTKIPRTYFATGRNDEGELILTLTDPGQEFLGYSRSSGGTRTLYFESRLNYSRYFNEIHHVDGLFLFNAKDRIIQDAANSILALPYRNTGIAGRTAYSYKDKYFTEFNFGYNGSENFQRGYRFGFFPSFALGWLVTNESFMNPVTPVLSKLKIRGSWGLVGNDQIVNNRRFAYISTIIQGEGYAFGYTDNFIYNTSWREGDFGVNNMTWETAEKMNLGVELGLWNTINLSLDLFKEKRKDIFMQRKTIPETAGYNIMPYANFGKVNNMGFEADLVINQQLTEDWFLSARGNFTFARNKIIEFDETEALKNTTRAHTGHSINQYFGLIAEGLYKEEDFEPGIEGLLKEGIPIPKFGIVKPGDIKYKDINGDKVIDSFDETAIGKPSVPEIVYGFGFNTRYKNFDLGVLFQGTGNFNNMLYGAKLIPGSGGGASGNIYFNADDRWMPENPRQDVFWPRLSSTENKHNMRYSTWWLRDVSYLRLKNFEIGYTIPKAWQKKVALNNARLFLRGTNILTFSKFNMWDPEIGSQDGLKYPLQKIFTSGFEITY